MVTFYVTHEDMQKPNEKLGNKTKNPSAWPSAWPCDGKVPGLRLDTTTTWLSSHYYTHLATQSFHDHWLFKVLYFLKEHFSTVIIDLVSCTPQFDPKKQNYMHAFHRGREKKRISSLKCLCDFSRLQNQSNYRFQRRTQFIKVEPRNQSKLSVNFVIAIVRSICAFARSAAADGILKRRIYGIVPYFGAKRTTNRSGCRKLIQTYRTIMGYLVSLRGRRYSSGRRHTTKTENYWILSTKPMIEYAIRMSWMRGRKMR